MAKKNKQKEIKGLATAKVERTPEKVGTDFTLVIPDDIYQQVMWWVHKSNHEVSGFGNLDYDEKTKTFTVRSVMLLDQEVGPTSTEIDAKALNRAIYETRNELNALKWHWHSHVNMSVFWSADDRELIRSLAHQGWIVASVFNKAYEVRTAFSEVVTVMGQEHEMFVDEIKTEMPRYLDAEMVERWDKEYDAKVKPESTGWTSLGNTAKDYLYGYDRELEEIHSKNVVDLSKAPKEDDSFGLYDQTGYMWCLRHNRWVYNPMFDDEVTTIPQIKRLIDEMDDVDIETSRQYSPQFEKILTDYLSEKAGGKNANQ